MNAITLAPEITTHAVAVRTALAGVGQFIALRPDTLKLMETGSQAQALINAVADDLELAQELTIDSPELLEEARLIAGRLATVCSDSGALEGERKALTAPFNDLVKALNAGYNAPKIHIAGVLDTLNSKILFWDREQKRLAAERQRKADEERAAELRRIAAAAAAATRLAEEKLAEAAQATPEQAAELVEEAGRLADTAREVATQDTVAARPVFVAPAAKTKGVVETWTVVITDPVALIVHVAERIAAGDKSLVGLLTPNESALKQKAKIEKDGYNVPGTRADGGSAVRTRKVAVA